MKVSVFVLDSLVPRTSGELQGISMYATCMQNESLCNSDRCWACKLSGTAQHLGAPFAKLLDLLDFHYETGH